MGMDLSVGSDIDAHLSLYILGSMLHSIST